MINTAAAFVLLFLVSLATPVFSDASNTRRLLSQSGAASECGLVSLSSALPRIQWSCATGQISRTNYANSESMSGIIISPVRPLSLTFSTFQTERNFDFVTVKSCADANCSQTTTLMRYAGVELPSPVVSVTGIMLVEWSSDGSVVFPGWSASWRLACPPGSYYDNTAGTNSRGLPFQAQ
jgi:hypothetical protein